MPATTPVYGIPYELISDPPDGADLGESGFLAVEDELVRIDAFADAMDTRLDAVITESAGTAPIATAWTDWTVPWTAASSNPTLGNGTITGRYKIVGKTCWYWFSINIGSTTNAGSGVYNFGLPNAATAKSSATQSSMGFRDNSAATQSVGFQAMTAGLNVTEGRYHGGNQVGPTTPYTWATSDFIRGWGCVEIN